PPPPPPPPPPPADPVIAAAGDIACDPGDPAYNAGLGTATSCRQLATSDVLTGRDLAAILTLGANQYDSGVLSAFGTAFHSTWGRMKSLIHPVPGNHEYQTAGAAGYYDYFDGVGAAGGPAG